MSTPRESSIVITPSWPTFSIASAINLPTSGLAAEIEAICSISSFVFTSCDIFFKASTATSVALSIPRRIPTGFAPEVTFFIPALTIAWVKTVAVVVPSPAISLVFEATSATNFAPIFSNWFSSSMLLAIVTPSLVIVGVP